MISSNLLETRSDLIELQTFEELGVDTIYYAGGLHIINSKIIHNKKQKLLWVSLHIRSNTNYPSTAKWGRILGLTLPTTYLVPVIIQSDDGNVIPYYVSINPRGEISQSATSECLAIWVNGIIKY